MTTDLGPDTDKSPGVQGDDLAYFIHSTIGNARPIGFELGPSVRVAYLVEGEAALARLNLRPLPGGSLWQAKLGWGPRGARKHLKFRVVGSMRWVSDPDEYRWQRRARRR